jgi:hypothetical protein
MPQHGVQKISRCLPDGVVITNRPYTDTYLFVIRFWSVTETTVGRLLSRTVRQWIALVNRKMVKAKNHYQLSTVVDIFLYEQEPIS